MIEQQPTYQKIVVPLDGHPWSERAIPHATQLARSSNAELILVHVFKSTSAKYVSELTLADQGTQLNAVREQREGYLSTLAKKLRKQKVEVRAQIIESAEIARSISDYVSSEGADLVVMASVGRNRLTRFLIGDAASQIKRRVNVPVLLIGVNEEAESVSGQLEAFNHKTQAPDDVTISAAPLYEKLLPQLIALRDAGILTEEEFQAKEALLYQQAKIEQPIQ